jgi:hypothetical protein
MQPFRREVRHHLLVGGVGFPPAASMNDLPKRACVLADRIEINNGVAVAFGEFLQLG